MHLANILLIFVAAALALLFFIIVPPISLSTHPGGKGILRSPVGLFLTGGAIMLLGLLLLR